MKMIKCCLPLLFLASSAFAQSYSRTLATCDQARLEDICWNNLVTTECRRQLIVIGESARSNIASRHMVFSNSMNEIILPELQNISGSNDLKDESSAFRSGGRVHFVKINGEGPGTIVIESFETTQSTGGTYSQQNMVGSYVFRDCH